MNYQPGERVRLMVDRAIGEGYIYAWVKYSDRRHHDYVKMQFYGAVRAEHEPHVVQAIAKCLMECKSGASLKAIKIESAHGTWEDLTWSGKWHPV